MAASVGSLMIRSTLRPEMVPTPFVAWRLELLLDAGLVVLAVGEGLALDDLVEVPLPPPSLSLSPFSVSPAVAFTSKAPPWLNWKLEI